MPDPPTPERREHIRALGRKRQNAYIARLKEKARGLLGGKCAGCGTTETLEFHHKHRAWHRARGYQDGKLRRILANIENYELRCAACHVKAHAYEPDHPCHRRAAPEVAANA